MFALWCWVESLTPVPFLSFLSAFSAPSPAFLIHSLSGTYRLYFGCASGHFPLFILCTFWALPQQTPAPNLQGPSGGENIWKDSACTLEERQQFWDLIWGNILRTPTKGCYICSQIYKHTQEHTRTEWLFRDSVGVHTTLFPNTTARWGSGRQGEVGTESYKWMLIVWLLRITLKSSKFIHKPKLSVRPWVRVFVKWSCFMA